MKVIDILDRTRVGTEIILYFKDANGFPSKRKMATGDIDETLRFGEMEVIEIGSTFDLQAGFDFLSITAEAKTKKAKQNLLEE